ncbi:DUF5985 family protein [Verrucomicrobium spinosum]|uniref:DUF5985 family protein n=1 Tax=Verrucomicrobium spinosum TaxID=2736 RepID=UPI000174538C|nr:DUF5985 family protein [Verrucomicrobium spinosum]
MVETVYILCSLSAFACAILLFRGYRETRLPLLLWSALCFTLLAATNVVLILDMIVYPSRDLSLQRNLLTGAAMAVQLYGLIFNSRSS